MDPADGVGIFEVLKRCGVNPADHLTAVQLLMGRFSPGGISPTRSTPTSSVVLDNTKMEVMTEIPSSISLGGRECWVRYEGPNLVPAWSVGRLGMRRKNVGWWGVSDVGRRDMWPAAAPRSWPASHEGNRAIRTRPAQSASQTIWSQSMSWVSGGGEAIAKAADERAVAPQKEVEAHHVRCRGRDCRWDAESLRRPWPRRWADGYPAILARPRKRVGEGARREAAGHRRRCRWVQGSEAAEEEATVFPDLSHGRGLSPKAGWWRQGISHRRPTS